MIPITLIIGANIYFDFQDIPIVNPPRLSTIINSPQNSHPIVDESPLRTSIFSGLFIVIRIPVELEIIVISLDGKYIFIGYLLGIFLVKGPIIAIWTHHQLKQKSLKNPPPKEMNEVELTLSAQPQFSQLEINVL